MKRTRHKRTPSVRRRALEIIAAHPDGCAEAMLAAHDIPANLLIELVQSGLVIARIEHIDEEDGTHEVTRVWITESGKRVLRLGDSCRWPATVHGITRSKRLPRSFVEAADSQFRQGLTMSRH
jgi:hypothetical protein